MFVFGHTRLLGVGDLSRSVFSYIIVVFRRQTSRQAHADLQGKLRAGVRSLVGALGGVGPGGVLVSLGPFPAAIERRPRYSVWEREKEREKRLELS